jgi:hypothetical protein
MTAWPAAARFDRRVNGVGQRREQFEKDALQQQDVIGRRLPLLLEPAEQGKENCASKERSREEDPAQGRRVVAAGVEQLENGRFRSRLQPCEMDEEETDGRPGRSPSNNRPARSRYHWRPPARGCCHLRKKYSFPSKTKTSTQMSRRRLTWRLPASKTRNPLKYGRQLPGVQNDDVFSHKSPSTENASFYSVKYTS